MSHDDYDDDDDNNDDDEKLKGNTGKIAIPVDELRVFFSNPLRLSAGVREEGRDDSTLQVAQETR